MKVSVIHAVVVSTVIAAANPAISADKPKPTATEKWLELQRGGAGSISAHKRVEGEMSQRSYRRLLDSFEHDIPASFFPSEGGNSGSRN